MPNVRIEFRDGHRVVSVQKDIGDVSYAWRSVSHDVVAKVIRAAAEDVIAALAPREPETDD